MVSGLIHWIIYGFFYGICAYFLSLKSLSIGPFESTNGPWLTGLLCGLYYFWANARHCFSISIKNKIEFLAVLVSFVLLGIGFINTPEVSKWGLFFLGNIMAFLYFFDKTSTLIRGNILLKPIWITSVWILFCVILPVYSSLNSFEALTKEHLFFICAQIFLLFAGCILRDWYDLKAEKMKMDTTQQNHMADANRFFFGRIVPLIGLWLAMTLAFLNYSHTLELILLTLVWAFVHRPKQLTRLIPMNYLLCDALFLFQLLL